MLHNFSNGHKVVIQTPYKQSLIQNQMIETFGMVSVTFKITGNTFWIAKTDE